jgi:hypothetical protein
MIRRRAMLLLLYVLLHIEVSLFVTATDDGWVASESETVPLVIVV